MAKYTSTPFGTKTRGDRTTPNKTQIAAAYDILSEGEIEGLSDGFASIYINDVPVIDTLANEILKNRNITVNTTANSTTISNSVFGTIDGLSNNNRSGLQLGGRQILLEKAGKKGTGIASATVNTNTVTTSSSFFTSSLIAGLKSGRLQGYVRIAGAGANGTDLVTTAIFVSATEITINALVGTTVSGADIFLDHITSISSISGNNATLATAPGVTISNATGIVTGANTQETAFKNLFNIENLQFGLVTGTLGQSPIQMNSSFGQSSIIASPNIELEQNNLRANIGTTGNLVSGYNNELDEPSQTEGTSADTLLTSAFLDVSNPSEIDEVHLTFNLASCHAIKNSSGAKGPSFVELQIFFEYSTDGGSSYTSELAFGPSNNDILTRAAGGGGRKINFFARDLVDLPNNGYIKPSKAQYAAFVEEFVINTEQFQPFDNWRIRVRRINDLNFKDGSFQHTNPCTLTTVESIIKDKFTYPHTAYAYTSFNAKDYDGQVPSRAFALKGMKIQVPTNYRTREETGGAAAYTRNISTGAAESSYQNWDGNFRGDVETFDQASVNHAKVFCDNPVWVMYDMLTNNRYGMGQFVDKENIDKYELFRLAKYCDEEIPDGNGGTEPRFTCNVYLSEAGEATTVLKQLASVFHGMTLWANGEFTATADQPKQPVALFSKANVIDGQFTYEGTGDRVRTNQIKVTWNDPDDNFRQATEYVEDYQDIAEKGRIVRSESLAFGCTSRGQAHRMGKWKLLSERNERETVSFETGINAIGLLPGQVIGVQDADRDRISYAGRVSNFNPEEGLTLDETMGSGGSAQAINAAEGSEPKYVGNEQTGNVVFAGEVTLPSSFSQDACMWEHGGTGVGSWLGVRSISGTYNLTLRSGEGNAAVTETSADGIVSNIPIADIPEFDDGVHTVVWEFAPDTTPGTQRLWIDGKLYIDDETTSGTLETGKWTGGNEGGWLMAQGTQSGGLSANSWPVTAGSSGLRHYFGELISSSEYGSSTTEVKLDRTISLPAYDAAFPHELVLMYPKGGAYLIDDNATIGGIAYVKGDLIPTITSSTEAANEEANVEWVEDFTTEVQPISTSAGNVNKLTVSSAFTQPPSPETIWALKLYNTDGTEKVGTIKEYRIISINEDDEKYTIAAAEYHREKFAEVERGYALQARPTKESADPDDVVPAPTNLVIAVEPMDSSDPTSSTDTSGVITGNKVTITWDYPENSDGSKYKFANGFELAHTFEGEEKTVLVGTVDQSFTINNVTAGKYSAKIRTKTAIGSVSQFTRREIEILESEFIVPGVTRTSLVPTGGSVNSSVSINSSSGLLEFGGSSYTLINANGVSFVNTSTNTATYQQSFAGMGANATAFLIFDSSESTDKLKAIQVHTDGEVEYFKEVGASNDGLSTPSGLITIAKGSNQVTGASTAFTTEFNPGDLFKILNGSSTTRTTSGATTTSKSVTLSSANSNIKVGQTVGNIPTQTVDGETVSFGTVFVEAIDGTSLTLSTKLSIPNGTNLSFTPQVVYRRVRSIESDTLLFLDNIVNRPYTSQGYRSQSFKPDLTNDTIIAKITTNGSTVYSIAEQLATFSPAAVTRIGKGFVYFSGWNGTDALPSAPSATSYDFDSTSLQGLTVGWSEDKPVAPYAVAAWTFKEGSASVTFDTVRGVSSWIGIPPDDFRINIDDTNRRIKIRPDVNDSGFDQQIDVPQLYNDRITTNADGTLNNAGGGTAPTVDAITGTTDFQSRVETGLTDAGILNTTVPVGKGGTGETNTNKFLNSDLGISLDGTNITLTKAGDTDSTDTVPAALKNSSIELSASGGTVSLVNASSSNNSFTKTEIGLSAVTNHAQVKDDLSNLTVQTANLEVVGGELRPKATLTNSTISIDSNGKITGANSAFNSVVLSNDKIIEANLVDSGGSKVFTVKPNKTVVDAGSVEGQFTIATDGGSATGVDVFTSDERDKLDNLRAGKQPTDNTKSILNSDVKLKIETSGIFQGRVSIDQEGTTTGSSTFIDVNKTNLGLDYEDGATIGARLGSGGTGNLFREDGTTKATDSVVITSLGTSNDTSNVNSISSSNVTAGAEQAQTNFGNHIQDLKTGDAEINAGSLDTGTIDTNLLKVDEIQLPSAGLSQSGSSKNFSSSAAGSNTFLFNAGSGPGYYQGFVDVDPTNNTLKGGAPNTNGPSLVIYGNGSLVHQSSFPENHVYNSGSGFAASEVGSVHVPFGFYYEGSGTVAVYIRMESTGGTATATVRGRAIKFGAEVASFDLSSFTASRTGITAGANSDSGTVTVSSISSGTTVSLTGNSNATVSINGGTFTSSPGTINNNQTFEIRIPASSTAGVSRSATVTIAGQSVTYTVTTDGTYSGSYGGGGSGGGGFQNEVDLR